MENLIAMNERVWNTRRIKTDAEFMSAFKPIYHLAALILG